MQNKNKIVDSVLLPVDEVEENDWNPNEQESDVFNELVKDIEEEGFDEPLQVVEIPETPEGKKYRIIGGAHRFRGVQHLGWEYVPAVIKEYSTEEEQKIRTVRRNMLKGQLDRQKFTKLINSLGRLVDLDLAVQLGMRNTDKVLQSMLNSRGNYDPSLAEKVKDARREEVALKNLSMILNKLFVEFGDTLKSRYMFFTYGTKLHLMLMMDRKLQKNC